MGQKGESRPGQEEVRVRAAMGESQALFASPGIGGITEPHCLVNEGLRKTLAQFLLVVRDL